MATTTTRRTVKKVAAKKAPAAPKLPPEIEELDDLKESMNFLVYGDSGVGKTVFGAKLPNLLIIRAEDGLISAKRAGAKAKVWPIREWNDMLKVYEYLSYGEHPFEWVMIDSLTNLQQRCIRGILKNELGKNPTRDPHLPQLQDYFKWQQMVKEMITDLNELPVNVLWTAQAMVRENHEGEDMILPLIEGKDYQISAWACAQMDLVACLRLRSMKVKGSDETRVVRQLITGDTPPYWSKDRYSVLEKTINNPDINSLVETIVGSESKPTANGPVRRRVRKTTTREK